MIVNKWWKALIWEIFLSSGYDKAFSINHRTVPVETYFGVTNTAGTVFQILTIKWSYTDFSRSTTTHNLCGVWTSYLPHFNICFRNLSTDPEVILLLWQLLRTSMMERHRFRWKRNWTPGKLQMYVARGLKGNIFWSTLECGLLINECDASWHMTNFSWGGSEVDKHICDSLSKGNYKVLKFKNSLRDSGFLLKSPLLETSVDDFTK